MRSSTCSRAAELELYLRGCPRYWCARWRHGARHTTERATRPTSIRRRQRTPSASFSLPPANPPLLSKSLSRRPRERRRPPGRRDDEKYAAGAAAAPHSPARARRRRVITAAAGRGRWFRVSPAFRGRWRRSLVKHMVAWWCGGVVVCSLSIALHLLHLPNDASIYPKTLARQRRRSSRHHRHHHHHRRAAEGSAGRADDDR